MIDEEQADQGLEALLLSLLDTGTSAESLLAAWLIKTRAVNHSLKAKIEQLKAVPK